MILLTHSDETLSFADSYATATWENTELCIVNCGPNRTNPVNPVQCNYVHRDWWNTIGESGTAIVAEISRMGNTYSMNYKYYVSDLYEWAFHYDKDPLSYIMHSYHETGDAQEYKMTGSFSGTVSWEVGETAYTMDVFNQIQDTMKYWQSAEQWDRSNEYARFVAEAKNYINNTGSEGGWT